MEKLANKFLNDNELINRLFEANPQINNKIFDIYGNYIFPTDIVMEKPNTAYSITDTPNLVYNENIKFY